MSPLDFHNLNTTYPEFARVWETLEEISSERLYHGKFIDPRGLIRRLRAERVEATTVVRALDMLVLKGVLQQVYVLVNLKNDDWLSEVVDSPLEIPDVAHDFEHLIETTETDIVPLYLDCED